MSKTSTSYKVNRSPFTLYLLHCGYLILLFLTSCQSTKEVESKAPKVVYFIVDGIPADVMQKLDPPVMKEISGAGGFTVAFVGGGKDSYSQSPTISAVGYNHLLTGTWTNKHNVWDNDIAAPNYNYKSLFGLVKESNPNLKTAVFSTWLDNRTKLIGEGLEATGKTAVDFHFDGLELDTVRFPHDNESQYIHLIDEVISDSAARTIAQHGPDLTWVYLEFTDDMGHRYGDSPQFYDAIQMADKQIGKVWKAIKEREAKFNEDWLIIITTDHGRDAETGRNHGGQSDRERTTWIVTNAKERNEHFNQKPGVVDVFPSITSHLKLNLNDEVANELDGVPFIGTIDMAELKAERTGSVINLSWKNFTLEGDTKVQLLLSTTNNFKTGGKDSYQKIGEVSVKQQHFEFEPQVASTFYKILAVTPHQKLNVWITENGK